MKTPDTIEITLTAEQKADWERGHIDGRRIRSQGVSRGEFGHCQSLSAIYLHGFNHGYNPKSYYNL